MPPQFPRSLMAGALLCSFLCIAHTASAAGNETNDSFSRANLTFYKSCGVVTALLLWQCPRRCFLNYARSCPALLLGFFLSYTAHHTTQICRVDSL